MLRVAVGVDPGLRACGVAVVDVQTSALLRAWLVKSPEKEDDGAQAWEAMARAVARELDQDMQGRAERMGRLRLEVLAVERQAIRGDQRRGLLTKNPGQILGLTAVCGGILVLVPAASKVSVYPQSWNGSRRKEISSKVIWHGLTPEEQGRCEGGTLVSTGHNVRDAAGIAKWAAHRTRALLRAV